MILLLQNPHLRSSMFTLTLGGFWFFSIFLNMLYYPLLVIVHLLLNCNFTSWAQTSNSSSLVYLSFLCFLFTNCVFLTSVNGAWRWVGCNGHLVFPIAYGCNGLYVFSSLSWWSYCDFKPPFSHNFLLCFLLIVVMEVWWFWTRSNVSNFWWQ